MYYLQSLFSSANLGGVAKVHTITGRAVQWVTFVLLLAGIVGLSACGKGNATGTVTAVSITPTSGSVSVNQQLEFLANVTVSGSTSSNPVTTNTTVTWSVNNIVGGNSTLGTIVNDPNDAQAGVYTAPSTVPSTNSGQVSITASAQRNPNGSASGGANTPVTSNAASLTITPGLGLLIGNTTSTVFAGGSWQFNATFNGVADVNATWAISSTNGGNIGSITNAGIYTAPSFPPPGDVVTITVTDSSTGTSVSKSTTVQIAYSDPTLRGNFAFSYTGNDASGYLAAAGSFVTDGNGGIIGGIEDISSFSTGVATAVQIKKGSGYHVGVDGRGIATLVTNAVGSLSTQTIAFVLTTNQHAIITRFDSSATGSGSMDQQDLTALGGSVSTVSGPYAFSVLGADAAFNPEGIAGEFSANGGTISAAGASIDVHDGATSTPTITSAAPLSSDSSYSFDQSNLGTGRGTLTLNVGASALQFAFYTVDSTELYLVEIDGAQAFLAGRAFSAVTGAPGLPNSTYVMTAGGSATHSGTIGAYAMGSAFASNGTGSVTSGTLDVNNQGTATINTALATTCGYTVNGSTGRIDLKLCTSGSDFEFALYPYQTDLASLTPTGFLAVEIDSNAATTGVAFQSAVAASVQSGGFALGLAGQGVSHGSRSTAAQNVDGHFFGSSGTSNAIDVNFFAATSGDPISSLSLGSATNARGALIIKASSPPVTYTLIYYVVSNNEALLFDSDANSSFVLLGTLERQF